MVIWQTSIVNYLMSYCFRPAQNNSSCWKDRECVDGEVNVQGTSIALPEMQESFHQDISVGMLISVCFLDISAGFDTVPNT